MESFKQPKEFRWFKATVNLPTILTFVFNKKEYNTVDSVFKMVFFLKYVCKTVRQGHNRYIFSGNNVSAIRVLEKVHRKLWKGTMSSAQYSMFM